MTDYPFNANKPVKADTITNFCIYTEQNAEHIYRALFGFVRRPKFRWKDADEIYIGPGCYHHGGSTRDRLVWWNSELTFHFEGTGSNANSDALGNNEWHYLFIDDSAVNTLASNELTAACFLNDTTAPTWSDIYHGWYTGNDRCIGAFRTGGTANILEFFHDGSDLLCYATYITASSELQPSNTYTDADCTGGVPGFSTKALLSFSMSYIDADATAGVRVNGQTTATGQLVGTVAAATTWMANTFIVFLSSAQVIEVAWSVATTNKISTYVDGWFFPTGM